MEGRRLILKGRIVIEDGEAGLADGFLWLWFSGMTLQEASVLMFDPARTEKIRFQYGDFEDTYIGYTNCINLSTDAEGRISVCLKKAVNE